MTAVSVFCDNFLEIIFPRMFFAIVVSACIPCCISLINDYFSHRDKARANSFFCLGNYLGVGLSSLTIILDQ